MTGWLLDTDVVSAFAPGRPQPSPEFDEWLNQREDRLFLSAITAAEIHSGIAKLRRNGAARRAAALDEWFGTILAFYADRVLPFDLTSARIAGELLDAASRSGRHPGFADVAIAATAKSHGLVLLSRNIRHFEPLGISVFDPFERS